MRDRLPALPQGVRGFSWGAFLIPPIWGVAHGQWPGVFFLPLWVFVDNVLRGPRPFGAWSLLLGIAMAAVTVGAQLAFAWHANRYAWSRVAGRTTPETFARRERAWGAVGLVTVAGMAAWIAVFLTRS